MDSGATVAAALSIAGSCLILWHASIREGTRDRLLLGLSLVDCIASFKLIVFVFFHQVDRQPGLDCSAEAFLRVWLDNSAPLYNAALFVYFLLVVRYRWTQDTLSKIEPVLHAIPLLYPLSFAVAGLAMDVYAPVEGFTVCGASAFPFGCDEDPSSCINGTARYRIVFIPTHVIITPFTFTLLVVASGLMIHTVRKSDTSDGLFRHTRRVASQASHWLLAYIVTYGFASAIFCVYLFNPIFSYDDFYWLALLAQSFAPLQGLMDAMVYFRPRYLLFRRNAELNRLNSFYSAVFTKAQAPTTISQPPTRRYRTEQDTKIPTTSSSASQTHAQSHVGD